MNNQHCYTSIRRSPLAAAIGISLVLATVMNASPGGAALPAGESAWEALVREQPEAISLTTSLEKRILQVLTSEQAERFADGADPSTIILSTGETLAELIAHAERTSAAGLTLQPTYPCIIFDSREAGAKFSTDETRVVRVRGTRSDYSPQGGAALGCGVPGLIGQAVKTNAARAVLLHVEAVEPEGRGSVAIWAAGAEDMPDVGLLSYGGSGQPGRTGSLAIVPLCGEESPQPCAEGDIRVQARGAGTHLAISVLGYFEPASAKPLAGSEEREDGLQADMRSAAASAGVVWDGSSVRICVDAKHGEMRFSSDPTCLPQELTIDLPALDSEGSVHIPEGDVTIEKGDLLVGEGDVTVAGGAIEVAGEIRSLTGAIDFGDGDLTTTGVVSGLGIVPIGTIVAWHRDLAGTPPLPDGWVECKGQVLGDPGSPYDGQAIPDLNGEERFLRGGTDSGTPEDFQIQSHGHGAGSLSTDEEGGHSHPGSFEIRTRKTDKAYTTVQGLLKYKMEDSSLTTLTVDVGVAGSHSHSIVGLSEETGGDETRPINMSVVWIMRVR